VFILYIIDSTQLISRKVRRKIMEVFDADAHVEEWERTFGNPYFDSALWERRPQVVGGDSKAQWLIEDRLFPKLVGQGCHLLGTPTGYGLVRRKITAIKKETIESMELRDTAARIKDMDREGLDVQVIFPTMFIVHPLATDQVLLHAIYRSYNSWMADICSEKPERLKWVAPLPLDDPISATTEAVRATEKLGASGVMLLGTFGEDLLDSPRVSPLLDELNKREIPVAVHLGWSCPPLSSLYHKLFQSAIMPVSVPVFMAFLSVIAGGILDRFPNLRFGFFEVGSLWVPYWLERMDHFYEVRDRLPDVHYQAEKKPSDYMREGRLFVNCEVDEKWLPMVIEAIGEDALLYASDMPHGDRVPDSVQILRNRSDIPSSAKRKILRDNALRFYGIA
jgi:predicted TIM-barrel fold metal-dependent hydrolase